MENELNVNDYRVITIEDENNNTMYLVSASEIETEAVCNIEREDYVNSQYEDCENEDEIFVDNTECEVIRYRDKFGNTKMLVNNPNTYNEFNDVNEELATKIITAYLEDDFSEYKFIPQKYYEHYFYISKVVDAEYEESDDKDEDYYDGYYH